MKRHFTGAVYDIDTLEKTQVVVNGLIDQLEHMTERKARLAAKLASKQVTIETLSAQLAKAEAVLSEISWFGREEYMHDHDYQGDGHTAREYFDDVYGPNYCAVKDSQVKARV